MNSSEARELLADYLGDELSPDQRRGFEAQLAHDPELAAEVENLGGALAALGSLELPAPVEPVVRMPAHAFLRYAAVVLLAFGAGYWANAAVSGSGATPRSGEVRVVERSAARDFEMRMAAAYSSQPGRSGLARSLVALARASKRP